MRKISVAWNNCFRRIFHVVERVLNHYNIFAPHSQCRISFGSTNCFLLLFWKKKIYWSASTALLSLSRCTYNAFIAIGNNFGMLTPKLSDSLITCKNLHCYLCRTVTMVLWVYYFSLILYSCIVFSLTVYLLCCHIWRSLIINILCNSLFCTARKRVNDRPETVQWKYCRMHGRSIWLCIYCYRRWVEMSDEIAELIDSCRCVIVVLQVMTWYSVGVTSPT